jgi:CRISPR-associated exonuclease Cas4
MIGTAWPDVLLPFIVVALLVGGALALLVAYRARRDARLPAGRIIYADTGDWRPPDRPLFSNRYRLVGKPDYLVSTRTGVIPVEVKSGGTLAQPYPSHVLQLAAYCLLVEETQATAPPHGLIRYPKATFQVDYTSALRDQLVSVLDAMRSDLGQADVARSHDDPRRCVGCGYRAACGEALD